tara:strand:- start:2644 stop:3522 length:879 start_codon:yes stop_codon:yes gene_type:complete
VCFTILFVSPFTWAELNIQDEQGTFTISGVPKRIVVLELSFANALATVGISPVGIADDNDSNILLPEVKKHLKPWVSLGMRSQPNLEIISTLKPDLIIADFERHSSIYSNLSRIAPTLLLKSRSQTYEENLEAAKKIGMAVFEDTQMKKRIREHKAIMNDYRQAFSEMKLTQTMQFAIVNSRGMWLHGPSSYTGGVLNALGIKSPIPKETVTPYLATSMELLLNVNPDWLLVGAYGNHTILDEWYENTILIKMLHSVKNDQIIYVSPELWSLNRGMLAAEGIAKNLYNIVSH